MTDETNGLVASNPPGWGEALRVGLGVYLSTALLVVAGGWHGQEFSDAGRATFSARLFSHWDGLWYERIAATGYTYDRNSMCEVAFFPAYPMFARGVARATGVTCNVGLLITAHLALAAGTVLFARYAFLRLPRSEAVFAVVAYGLMPNTFFHRMPYSESLFFTLAVLTLWLAHTRRHWLLVSVVAGIASATRPVGVALAGVAALSAVRVSTLNCVAGLRVGTALVIGTSGLLAYAGYQWSAFGTPLAFVHAQDNWVMWQRWRDTPSEKFESLSVFEPFWEPLDPESHRFWAKEHMIDARGIFGPLVFDRVFYALALAALAVGVHRQWLSQEEVAATIVLLLIPYITRAHEMALFSAGRFASVAPPLYLVYGRWVAALPDWARGALAAWCGFLLTVYSARFAVGRLMI